MRFLSIFALACTVLQAVSALPVFNLTSDLIAHDDPYIYAEHLEARGKGHQHKDSKKPVLPPPSPITFLKDHRTHSPKNNLDRLELHGQKRKNVEKWHEDLVAKHMKTVKGAHTAEIVNLAHAVGSKDPHMHVSVNYYNKEKQPIFTPQRGDGVMKATTHVYVNPADPKNAHHLLPIEYRKAMEKHAK